MQLEKLPSIWIDSPLTISYNSNRAASIDRTKRFHIDSIYYKDDPTKPKKKVDQLMFPMQILQDFRKNIKEASKSKEKKKNTKRPPSIYDQEEQKSTLGSRADSITRRLYSKPDPLFLQRDSFGNRCSMQEKQLNQIIKLPTFMMSPKKKSLEKLYVTAANRMDLSKPSNFNPGPGSYLKEAVFSSISKSSHNGSIMSDEYILKRKRRQRTVLQSIHSSVVEKIE